jgi:hypothetical protein
LIKCDKISDVYYVESTIIVRDHLNIWNEQKGDVHCKSVAESQPQPAMGKGVPDPPRSFQIIVCIKENVLTNLIFP